MTEKTENYYTPTQHLLQLSELDKLMKSGEVETALNTLALISVDYPNLAEFALTWLVRENPGYSLNSAEPSPTSEEALEIMRNMGFREAHALPTRLVAVLQDEDALASEHYIG